MNIEEEAKRNLVVRVLAGSRAYGTNHAASDYDHRGIFYADPIHYLTPFFPVREVADSTQDNKLYELDHYLKLYLDGNPNILEVLWADKNDVLESNWIYDELLVYREALLSAKVAFTFTGYAASQISRIRGHNKWLNNPKPIDPPKQIDFVSLVRNFTSEKIFKIDIRDYHDGYRLIPYGGNVFGIYEMSGYQTFDKNFALNTRYDDDIANPEEVISKIPLFIVKFNVTEYNREKDDWTGYWKWKKNRNIIRGKLEEQFGYDVKHGMHCVRLMRMGKEILETGKVIVKRPDYQELLDIRNGAWTYEQILEYAEEMDELIRNKLYKSTRLRRTPDVELAARVLIDIKQKIIG